jgi:hypothetical protein
MLILSDIQAIIFWLLPFIIFICLVRKANKILKENNENLNAYLFNSDKLLFFIVMLIPVFNIAVLITSFILELYNIFKLNRKTLFFTVNGRKLSLGKMLDKLFNS